MRVEVTRCDVCGAIKGDGNKWLKATIGLTDRFGIHPPGVHIGACGTTDICSDSCLYKLLAPILAQIRSRPVGEEVPVAK